MPTPPGQLGLVGRLEHLQRQIDELSRRSSGHGDELETVEVTTPSEITFTNIPPWYRHLQLVIAGGQTGTVSNGIRCSYNGITSGYDYAYTVAIGTGTTSNKHNGMGYVEVGAIGPSSWQRSATSTTIIGGYGTQGLVFSTTQCSYVAAAGDLRVWSGSGMYWRAPGIVVSSMRLWPANALFSTGTVASLYGLR